MKHTLILCAFTLAFVGCANTVNKAEYNQLADAFRVVVLQRVLRTLTLPT